MMCAMMASESATESSLDLGVDFRISSRSASDEPKYTDTQTQAKKALDEHIKREYGQLEQTLFAKVASTRSKTVDGKDEELSGDGKELLCTTRPSGLNGGPVRE
jgi:hypothetical protein